MKHLALGYGIGSALSLMLGVACDGDSDGPRTFDPGPPGDPAQYQSFFMAPPYGIEACDSVDAQLHGSREVFLMRGPHVTEATIKDLAGSLQRYYRRHGLAFFTRHNIQTVKMTHALDTDTGKLNRELRRAFPKVNLDQPTAAEEDLLVAYALNFILRPVREFATTHGGQGTDKTHIVILRNLIPPNSANLFGDGALAGLAISPALLSEFTRDPSVDGAELWKTIDLPEVFTPMMFIDAAVVYQVAAIDPVGRDLVLAHEFGHTGALVHRDIHNNLMTPTLRPGAFTCADGLDADQLSLLRTTLELAAPVAAKPRPRVSALGTDVPPFRQPGLLGAFLRREPGSLGALLRPLLHPASAR